MAASWGGPRHGEMHQGGVLPGPFALAAALAAVADLLGVSALLDDCGVRVLASAIVVGALQARSRAGTVSCRRRSATGSAALVSRRAMVLERIANEEGVGCVRDRGGEVWTARSYDEDEVIEVGDRVEVKVEIMGATALVMH